MLDKKYLNITFQTIGKTGSKGPAFTFFISITVFTITDDDDSKFKISVPEDHLKVLLHRFFENQLGKQRR